MGIPSPSLYLADRLAVLRKTQNADGGWAYYPGKASWLEPTAYAAMALSGQPEADRAWGLIRHWQISSGGWRPTAEVPGPNWTTALAVLWADQRGEKASVEKGVEWLGNNTTEGAWPWRRNSLPAAEPTALATLALRHTGTPVTESVEKLLLADKLGPETCGPALVALQGSTQARSLADQAIRWAGETTSPLIRAWIHLGLRVNGLAIAEPAEAPIPRNLALAALEALAAQNGNHTLLRVEKSA